MKLNKVTVGLQQKIGQPNFGSAGASCIVEVHLDDHEASDSDAIGQRIRQAFTRCRTSIEEQLHRQAASTDDGTSHRAIERSAPATNGSAAGRGRPSRPATEKQVRAIQTIASKRGIVLASELQSRFHVSSPDQLSIGQASTLIDAMKEPVASA